MLLQFCSWPVACDWISPQVDFLANWRGVLDERACKCLEDVSTRLIPERREKYHAIVGKVSDRDAQGVNTWPAFSDLSKSKRAPQSPIELSCMWFLNNPGFLRRVFWVECD